MPGAVPFPDGRMQAPHIAVWIVARGINLGLLHADLLRGAGDRRRPAAGADRVAAPGGDAGGAARRARCGATTSTCRARRRPCSSTSEDAGVEAIAGEGGAPRSRAWSPAGPTSVSGRAGGAPDSRPACRARRTIRETGASQLRVGPPRFLAPGNAARPGAGPSAAHPVELPIRHHRAAAPGPLDCRATRHKTGPLIVRRQGAIISKAGGAAWVS